MRLRPQIFVKSPFNYQSLALRLDPTHSLITVSALHSLLESSHRQSLSDFCFVLNGKPLDITSRISVSEIPPVSTLTLYPRYRAGGGDGGATGAESRDCYLNMYAEKKPDKVDPNEQRLSKWLNCALSNEPLTEPCVTDFLGNVFNKVPLVEALVSKRLPKQFSHIKGLKDMVNIKFTPITVSDQSTRDGSSAQFQCPVSGLELNGKYRFLALRGCGHVLSAKALKEVKSSSCLVCHTDFTESDKIPINGSEEEVDVLRERMKEEKAKKGASRKSASKKGKNSENAMKRRHDNGAVGDGAAVKKFRAGDMAPANATKEVYASIFTSSRKSDFKETYSCRSLPLGRN
ncbi:PREDICTED: protein RTF2 homolog [Tarenaya hassleriana]|uniref:protein RTF2 homolog n=1 Tax=Tarenaya hassleriana TaxID=28532 RepID=UPI00053C8148|nr:PREDICTED: protein RTF2 homolog [Tarenaya hassleriana]